MSTTDKREIVFRQYDIPPLKAAEYEIAVSQAVTAGTESQTFTAEMSFAVTGKRFVLAAGDVASVFPPDLSDGEFAGVLPHAILTDPKLPWIRTSVMAEQDAPWMAVFLFNEDEIPETAQKTAKDLVPLGKKITVAGSDLTGTGAMPEHTFSYPGYEVLDYGETPDDPCTIIDVPAAAFDRIAPTAKDLPLLAHVRETDDDAGLDGAVGTTRNAVVTGNRLSKTGANAQCYLVSLESFGPYLPKADGTSSLPPGTTTVRLVSFRTWRFFANDRAASFAALVEHLNLDANGKQLATTLVLPGVIAPLDPGAVALASNHAANGTLTDADADVLARNAYAMGYVPLAHELRRPGTTVSWYRGPLVPYPLGANPIVKIPATTPDALNRYDPQTGMFDVSYGAAWQLGQLLALHDRSIAVELYKRRHGIKRARAAEAEHERILAMLGGENAPFASIVHERTRRVRSAALRANAVVDEDPLATWLAALQRLVGVPFQYLVPDERMLPAESIRLFYLDPSWTDALRDGALSVGRYGAKDAQLDAEFQPALHAQALRTARNVRRRVKLGANAAAGGPITGFLLRSQVVSGWSNLQVHAFSDPNWTDEIERIRVDKIGDDVIIATFDGEIASLQIAEAPMEIHSGVEGAAPNLTTALRAIVAFGGTPVGQQFPNDHGQADSPVATRADGQTLDVTAAAAAVQQKLNTTYQQGITDFTSAEFAIEFVKGVVRVLFKKGSLT